MASATSGSASPSGSAETTAGRAETTARSAAVGATASELGGCGITLQPWLRKSRLLLLLRLTGESAHGLAQLGHRLQHLAQKLKHLAGLHTSARGSSPSEDRARLAELSGGGLLKRNKSYWNCHCFPQ